LQQKEKQVKNLTKKYDTLKNQIWDQNKQGIVKLCGKYTEKNYRKKRKNNNKTRLHFVERSHDIKGQNSR